MVLIASRIGLRHSAAPNDLCRRSSTARAGRPMKVRAYSLYTACKVLARGHWTEHCAAAQLSLSAYPLHPLRCGALAGASMVTKHDVMRGEGRGTNLDYKNWIKAAWSSCEA